MRHARGMLMTSGILKKRGICAGWRRRFRKKFPGGRVRITQEACEHYAQAWPWRTMAQKLLNAAGWAEYQKQEMILDNFSHQRFAWSAENPISKRARNVARASLFGYLAQLSQFDPAYTP